MCKYCDSLRKNHKIARVAILLYTPGVFYKALVVDGTTLDLCYVPITQCFKYDIGYYIAQNIDREWLKSDKFDETFKNSHSYYRKKIVDDTLIFFGKFMPSDKAIANDQYKYIHIKSTILPCTEKLRLILDEVQPKLLL